TSVPSVPSVPPAVMGLEAIEPFCADDTDGADANAAFCVAACDGHGMPCFDHRHHSGVFLYALARPHRRAHPLSISLKSTGRPSTSALVEAQRIPSPTSAAERRNLRFT